MASLVGRGLLSYETRISELWPAFGAGDKAQVRVADLMRHEAGLQPSIPRLTSTICSTT